MEKAMDLPQKEPDGWGARRAKLLPCKEWALQDLTGKPEPAAASLRPKEAAEPWSRGAQDLTGKLVKAFANGKA